MRKPENLPSKTYHLQDTALRYFLEVTRRGSVSEAALHLHVTASAVSRQISTLEQTLDVSLFERHPRGMRTTAAGELLAAHARRVSLDAAEVVSAIEAMQGMERGHIRLCCTGGFAIALLPAVIAEFRAQHPGITFSLDVVAPSDVTDRILEGTADIGITFSRTVHKGIHIQHSQTASVVIVMRPDHPLAAHRAVSLRQIQGQPIALPGTGATVRQLFDIACSNRQVTFDPVLVCDQFETLLNFVLEGGGLSIAGAASVHHRQQQGQLHYAVLREPGMQARTIQVQTLAGRQLSQAMSAFLALLKRRLKQLRHARNASPVHDPDPRAASGLQ